MWGKFPVPPEAPWLEPLIVLAAVASATSRVRLATGILIAPLRPAVLLAKQAATLDVLSRGRLDLGVGTGWQREEYDAEGIDFAQRGALLSDTIAACKVLWSDTPAALDTPTLSFRDVYCEPKPLQAGGVPLWIGGSLHARNLERLVRWGDAWIPIMGATIDDIADGARRIADAWRAAGRDPAGLQVQAPLRDRARRRRTPRPRSQHGVGARSGRGRSERHPRDVARLQRRSGRRSGGARRHRAPVRGQRRADRQYRLDRADSFRRLSDPPDAAAGRASRERRPEPLRPVLVQRIYRRLLLRGGDGGVPEPRHHRRRVRSGARRRAAFGVRVRAHSRRIARRRASAR